jgi:hypothetical protein
MAPTRAVSARRGADGETLEPTDAEGTGSWGSWDEL